MAQSGRGCLHRLTHAWESVQVELNGQYSQQRLQAFTAHARQFSLARAIAVCVLTPAPCLLVVIIADAIPLEPPERGLNHNDGFWTRALFYNTIFTISLLSQSEYHLAQLGLALKERIGIVVTVSVFITVTTYAIAAAIGFPLPFLVPMLSVPWLIIFMVSMWLIRRRLIRESEELRGDIKNFAMICYSQSATTLLYQVFYVAFAQMPPDTQTKFVFVLPVLKLLQKNSLSKFMSDEHDMKPEVVTLNVELFHAMFVSCCMQRSTSIYTSLALIGVDFFQACLSHYDLDCMLHSIEALAKEHGFQRAEFVPFALKIARQKPRTNRHMSRHVTSNNKKKKVAILNAEFAVSQNWVHLTGKSFRSLKSNRVQAFPGATENGIGETGPPPIAGTEPSVLSLVARSHAAAVLDALTEADKETFEQNILRAMYLTEFLLLVEFIEVAIPITYCVYLVVLFHLPNRVYYPHLADVDEESLRKTIQNVLLYASMELVSFLALLYTLRHRLRISGVQQLAFVLETQVGRVQAKLAMWFLYVLQSPLVHLGADYSFKFAWLHAPSPQAPSPGS